MKWMKRWVAPSVLAVLLILAFSIQGKLNMFILLGSGLYLAASNGFSYGDKFTKGKLSLKILFRALCGLQYGVCGLIVGLGAQHLGLGLPQLFLAVGASVGLGVTNPFSAMGNGGVILEDILISFGYVCLLPAMM